ncbi:hypothetical protein A0H81_12461 [Grifola frondosa]|uniref:Uncharacterized protein n=1 Tax=Grifola frondosa TaxID=5627 RepID=A0A1C7LTB5_GRIFR|nr:hypothetical protein A0H81_12461 [Grifola frondosa]
MAQGSYPAYLQQQQPYASYPSAGSQSPAPPSQSPYDPQTNYQARYQHPAYSQPLSTLNTGQTYPYPVPPQLQSVQGQSLTHASSPYTISPQSPVPLHVPLLPILNHISSVVNPYPSPTSPQNPQSPTRRPLPDPHRHLDSLSSHPHSLPTPQPSPSPGPFPPSQQVLHRPSNSVPSSAFARSNVTVPAGSSRDAPGTPLSPLSATSTSPPRPLPLPRSLGSFDLAGSHSESEIRSQSPTRRALPGTELPPVQRRIQGAHDQSAAQPLPAPGQKFVPLWKRSLPQPSPSSSVSPQPQGAIERRGTVSGASARPLPQSPVAIAGTSASAVSRAPANGASLPPHLQTHRLPPTPQSAVAPRSAFAPTATVSDLSRDLRLGLRERSRTLPTPATSPSSPPSLQTSSPPKPRPASPAKRLVESPASSDDEDLTNALLARPVRSPSPKYGILDMPSRSRIVQPTAVPRTEIAPRSPRTLPIQQSAPQTQASDSSVAFRLAALSLRSASPSRPSHGHSQSVGAPSTTRWPANLPPLPRAPTSPSPSSPASPHPRPLPSRNQSAFSSPGIRSPRKVDLDLSLDDAPPPSLRRSPAPSSPAPRESTRTPTSRSALPTIRTLTNSTPAMAPPNVPAFSLSSFPAPRSRQQSPRIPKITFPANVDENSR